MYRPFSSTTSRFLLCISLRQCIADGRLLLFEKSLHGVAGRGVKIGCSFQMKPIRSLTFYLSICFLWLPRHFSRGICLASLSTCLTPPPPVTKKKERDDGGGSSTFGHIIIVVICKRHKTFSELCYDCLLDTLLRSAPPHPTVKFSFPLYRIFFAFASSNWKTLKPCRHFRFSHSYGANIPLEMKDLNLIDFTNIHMYFSFDRK